MRILNIGSSGASLSETSVHKVGASSSRFHIAKKVEIMNHALESGPPIALIDLNPPPQLSSTSTLRDLFNLIRKRGGGCNGAAFHSAAASFAKFLGHTAEEVLINQLVVNLEQFSFFLLDRRYTKETAKSYRYCIGRLLKTTRENG